MKILLLVALDSQEDASIAPPFLTLETDPPMAFKPQKLWDADALPWHVEAFISPSYLIGALIPSFLAPVQDHTLTSKPS